MHHIARRWIIGPVVAICTLAASLVVAPAPAQAAVTGTIRVSGTLNIRSGATTASSAVGKLRNKARVSIACQVVGQRVRGNVRTTTLWDRLTNGRYVSHGYVVSGWVPRCPVKPVSRSGTVRVSGELRVRSSATTASAVVLKVRNNARLGILCQVTGQYVRGSVRATTLWDRLTNGRYVSHAYVVSGAIPRCSTPAPPVPPPPAPVAAGPMTNEQFIAASVPAAQRGWREFGVPVSVTIGQAILESGWGRSKLSANDRNYFGIKCFSGDPGDFAVGCRTYRTTECTKAGKCYTTSATFRVYKSMTDSYRDHGYFLRTNPRYAASFASNTKPDEFLYKIWKAGYATDPYYDKKVIGIMKTYNLYRYDLKS